MGVSYQSVADYSVDAYLRLHNFSRFQTRIVFTFLMNKSRVYITGSHNKITPR